MLDLTTFTNIVSGEALALTGSGTVADKNVGTNKVPVTLGTLALADNTNGQCIELQSRTSSHHSM